MQQSAQNPSSGKLDTIKAIGAILPDINALKKRCFEARVGLDASLTDLRDNMRSFTQQREEAIKRAENEKKYGELIKQRQEERLAAEKKIDERTESRLKAQEQKAQEVKAKPQPQTQFSNNNYTPRDGSQRPYPPRDGAPRSYPPRDGTQRPQYNNNGQQRTWTPSQATVRPQFGAQRTPYPPRDGTQRPYPPRDGSARPYPPRDGSRPPYGPRPAGAGGTPGRPLAGIKPTEKFVPKPDTSFAKKKTKGGGGFSEPKTSYDRRALLRRGIIEEQEIEERMLTRIFKSKKAKEGTRRDTSDSGPKAIVINTSMLTVKTLSEKIGKAATEIIKQLMVLGNMCTINSSIDFETASLVAMEFGLELELHADKTFEEKLGDVHKKDAVDDEKLEPRPPIVTVLGHVDHGKTSLLDAIRKTNVQSREHGGITQHIGAYQVKHNDKKITFIDTPGHAAFEKMRARGAKITDIAILLVAGDDGVMPQTVEAIKHIQKYKLPMIVAVNKMDKKESNIDRVKEQLSLHNVLTEEWGGDAVLVPISAVTGMGLDKLLEMILLVSEMNAYRANPNREAQGCIVDAKLDKAKGPMVTVIVQSGTLKIGDTLLAGTTSGKVRSMTDENGKVLRKAGPSTPVSVLGFSDVPKAGELVYVVDEKLTKQVVSERKTKEQVTRTKASTKVASDIDAIARLDLAAKKQLNVIIKGDVTGSVEAIIQSVKNITSDEVNINVISSGVGVVNDNDVALAEMAGAHLIAFNVKTSHTAAQKAKKLKVVIHEYRVIYEIFDYITEQMVRLFSAKFTEVYHGRTEVRALFKSSAVGLIAGCMVTDGKIVKSATIRLKRGEEVLGEYKIDSLKIKKDDVKEVSQGFECGVKLEGTVDLRIGDQLECIGQEQLPIMFNGRKYEF